MANTKNNTTKKNNGKPQPYFSAKANCMLYPVYNNNGDVVYVSIPE